MKRQVITLAIVMLVTGAVVGCTSSERKDAGMVAGGVVGGVAGSALTGGSTAGTIVGAVGGGYVGRKLSN